MKSFKQYYFNESQIQIPPEMEDAIKSYIKAWYGAYNYASLMKAFNKQRKGNAFKDSMEELAEDYKKMANEFNGEGLVEGADSDIELVDNPVLITDSNKKQKFAINLSGTRYEEKIDSAEGAWTAIRKNFINPRNLPAEKTDEPYLPVKILMNENSAEYKEYKKKGILGSYNPERKNLTVMFNIDKISDREKNSRFLEKLLNTVEHELRHFMQDIMSIALDTDFGKPSKALQDPEFNHEQLEAMVDAYGESKATERIKKMLQNKNLELSDLHDAEDEEFYTMLGTSVGIMQSVLKNWGDYINNRRFVKALIELDNNALSEILQNLQKNMFDKDKFKPIENELQSVYLFLRTIKKENREKWKKASSEIYKYLSKYL